MYVNMIIIQFKCTEIKIKSWQALEVDFKTSFLHQAWFEEKFGIPLWYFETSLADSDSVEELEVNIDDTEIWEEVCFKKPTLTCQDHVYHAVLASITVEEMA